uniref:hypothetical protein n=1 Tax=Bacillus zhangzhouensis TaxID=1178540 RepID=UPI00155DA57D|nr:hypothetical protein [Bacillus zhangzhouensis]
MRFFVLSAVRVKKQKYVLFPIQSQNGLRLAENFTYQGKNRLLLGSVVLAFNIKLHFLGGIVGGIYTISSCSDQNKRVVQAYKEIQCERC